MWAARWGGLPIKLDSGVRSRVDAYGMSSCCGSPDPVLAAVAARCPQSGTKGRAVDLLTVKALLCESALMAIRDGLYRFCAAPTCAVVYFDDEGHVFNTTDLRVPVWQKQPAGARQNSKLLRDRRSTATRKCLVHSVARRSWSI